MKFLRLMFQFFKKNPVMLVFVFLELTLSMFLFTDQLGVLQLETYAYEAYKDSSLSSFDYFAPEFPGEGAENNEELLRDIYALDGVTHVGQIKNMTVIKPDDYEKAVEDIKKGVLFYQVNYQSLRIYDPVTFKSFPLNFASGGWEGTANENEITVVACGEHAREYSVGDIIPVKVLDFFVPLEEGERGDITLKVVGTLSSPGFAVRFNIWGNKVMASDFIGATDGFVAAPTEKNYALLTEYFCYAQLHRCVMVGYEDNINDHTLSQTRTELKKWGTLTTPEEIIEHSENHMKSNLSKRLAMVLFFLVIASFTMISSVIVTQMKMSRTNSVYCLCGATARRCFMYSGVAVTLLGGAALMVNLVRIIYIKYNGLDIGIRRMPMLLNETTALILCGYFAVTLFVALASSYYVFRRNTPIESYKKHR